MKKIVSILLAMTLILSGMSAMAAVTKAGTEGTPTIDENFKSYNPGQFIPAADSNWKIVSGMGAEAKEDTKSYVTITNAGALEIHKSARELGAMYTADTKLLQGTADDAAKECVIEFNARIGKRQFIALGASNDTGKYLLITRENTTAGNVIFCIGADTSNTVVLTADGGNFHDYKIVLRSSNNDGRLRMKADVFVDGVCRVLDQVANADMSYSSSRGIDEFFVGDLNKNGATATTVNNIKMYALENEERSDVCAKYLDSTGVELSKDATSPAVAMATGSKLTAEIRYQGTVSENETVRVFVAQFDKDGVLKNVSFTDGTVTAGSNDKIEVTLTSTADAPLCTDAAADDYLSAFIWTADEMIPLCAEATVGKTE